MGRLTLRMVLPVITILFSILAASDLAAQQTFRACYVPQVGAMYLLDLPGLPGECLSTEHEEISWTEGGGAAGPVASDDIEDGAVTSAKLAEVAVTEVGLAEGAVTAAKLANGAVTEAGLAEGAVTAAKLGDGAVGPATLADGAVTPAALAPGAVTSTALADSAVDQSHLRGRSILESHLGVESVGSDQIQFGAVGSAEIGIGAVQSHHLAERSVRGDRLDLGIATQSELLGISPGVVTREIACPPGLEALVGGWTTNDAAISVSTSQPMWSEDGMPVGWIFAFRNDTGNTWLANLHVVCTDITG